MIARRLLAVAVLSAIASTSCNDSNNTNSQAAFSLGTTQKPFYTESGSLVIPSVRTVLYAAPEGLYDTSPTNRLDVLPPADADITKDPSARTDPYSNKLIFSPVQYVVAGGRDPTDNTGTCQTFPEAAKPALLAALNIWGSILNSPQPVTVSACWRSMGWSGWGVLAQATPGSFQTIPLNGSTVYAPAALANAIHKKDLDGRADVLVSINASAPWHMNPNTVPARNLNDLTTALLHEVGHGLGFISDSSGPTSNNRNGWWNSVTAGYSYIPLAYDFLLRDGSYRSLLDARIYPNNSVALGNAFNSNNLWFVGGRAKVANSGQSVKVHAQQLTTGQGSLSHLDYNTFSNTANQLMTPFLTPPGSRNHNPGPVTIAMLQDMGWGLVSTTPPPTNNLPGSTTLIAPSGTITVRTPTYSWRPASLATKYYLQVINKANNQAIFQSWQSPSCTSSTCSFRPNGSMSAGSYSWRIIPGNNAGNGPSSAFMNFTVR